MKDKKLISFIFLVVVIVLVGAVLAVNGKDLSTLDIDETVEVVSETIETKDVKSLSEFIKEEKASQEATEEPVTDETEDIVLTDEELYEAAREALKAFQERHDLEADGIPGKQTREAFKQYE